MAAPPFEAGAVNAMAALALAPVAETIAGAPGTVMTTAGATGVTVTLPDGANLW